MRGLKEGRRYCTKSEDASLVVLLELIRMAILPHDNPAFKKPRMVTRDLFNWS